MDIPSHVRQWIIVRLCLGALLPTVVAANEKPDGEIEWRKWSDDIFAQAKKEHRFVLLDLEAVWCHWCHVMDEQTYGDPKVIGLVRSRYIAVKVDQDSRPDISNRYEDYGWPATVVFNTDGSEIVKRRGYIPPGPMASMLQAIIDDPSPGPSITKEPPLDMDSGATLTLVARKKLEQELRTDYDNKNRGWGTVQKFLDWDIIEYCIGQTLVGDQDFERMARETLDAQRKLIDPAWGGAYQYSTDGDWDHPHFEKIMQMQAENLRVYAEAYALWKDPNYLRAARQIRSYLRNFLTSPEGAFYTSQDADLVPGKHSAEYFALNDNERRQRGIPRVDQHIYARENGWAINALATLYSVTGEIADLNDAVRAADWIIAHRSLPAGGFRHDETDANGPYLGDSVSMARSFLALYQVTGDRRWLQRAEEATQFAEEHFKRKIGYVAVAEALSAKLSPKPQADENAALARLTNLLHHYTGNPTERERAQHAMNYLALPAVANHRGFQVGGILLADRELNAPPLHITVVGRKDDPAARQLFLAAIAQPVTYKRVEWWDQREGGLPNSDVEYPQVETAAAFICTDRRCSAPIVDPAKIAAFSTSKK
ncbi:MAG TPA: DUF255 domain-containing protein [Chthoniobacterales bacterium]|jgi:uncharacterized protein YyaL (SSP411 family)|nr:DUF255 domain-containing protein [Chthoniobacterales bacterium]